MSIASASNLPHRYPLWLSGQSLQIHLLHLPTRKIREAEKMASFALEDKVNQPVEQLNFVLSLDKDSPKTGPAHWIACVIDKQQLALEQGQLADKLAQRPEAQLALDYLGLPLQEGQIAYCQLGDRTLVRLNAYQGFSCDTAQFEAIRAFTQWPEGEWMAYDSAALNLKNHPQLPLLQLFGLNSRNQGLLAKQLTLWKKTLWAALITCLLAYLYLFTSVIKQSDSLQALEAQNKQLAQAKFPQITRWVNPSVQIAQALKNPSSHLDGKTDFITAFGQPLKSLPKTAKIQSLDFAANRLLITLTGIESSGLKTWFSQQPTAQLLNENAGQLRIQLLTQVGSQ